MGVVPSLSRRRAALRKGAVLKRVLILISVSFALIAAILLSWRMLDHRWDLHVAAQLAEGAGASPARFDPAMIADQPEPVRRYFTHAIAPGTPLAGTVELHLEGRFNMGTTDAPHYRALYAKQVLNHPSGFVWQVVLRGDETWISGSDGAFQGQSWSRFWLMGALPVAREGGAPDHYKSAFGRYAAEAVFWSPASVLPGPNARWRAVSPGTVQVTLRHKAQTVVVDLVIDAAGAPVTVSFERWSNANAQKQYRWQRFGGHLSQPRRFGGITIPTRVLAGNDFGAPTFAPFYEATVTDARFLPE